VHGGATGFHPGQYGLVSVTKIGSDTISFAFIFAAPGFEDSCGRGVGAVALLDPD
jgi:hypothetical protein